MRIAPLIHFVIIACVSLFSLNSSKAQTSENFLGRWDLHVFKGQDTLSSWLEVEKSGYSTLVGRFVSTSGSARPIGEIIVENNVISFTIPPQWEKNIRAIRVNARLDAEKLTGKISYDDATSYEFEGQRAPRKLYRAPQNITYQPKIDLFNGVDLMGWQLSSEAENWKVENGILTNTAAGSNLISTRHFDDFTLLVEFRYPKGSNSGIYLRGRYEVQINDDAAGDFPDSHKFGGVYGFLTPNRIASLGPDTWQTMEITLIDRFVSIKANGQEIITHQEIPGITGAALDSHEHLPGPIYIQGDHGPIEFRKIELREIVSQP